MKQIRSFQDQIASTAATRKDPYVFPPFQWRIPTSNMFAGLFQVETDVIITEGYVETSNSTLAGYTFLVCKYPQFNAFGVGLKVVGSLPLPTGNVRGLYSSSLPLTPIGTLGDSVEFGGVITPSDYVFIFGSYVVGQSQVKPSGSTTVQLFGERV